MQIPRDRERQQIKSLSAREIVVGEVSRSVSSATIELVWLLQIPERQVQLLNPEELRGPNRFAVVARDWQQVPGQQVATYPRQETTFT